MFQIILFLATGIIILYWVYNKQAESYRAQCALDGRTQEECNLLEKVISDFGNVHWDWMAVVLLLFILSNISRMMRWKMLLKPLGRNLNPYTGFFAILLGYFANLGFPRIGEVVRAATVARYERLPFEKVMGTVAVDRIVDLLTLILIVIITLFVSSELIFQFLREYASFEANAWGIVKLIILFAFLVFVSMYIWKKRISLMRYQVFRWLFKMIRGFVAGILAVRLVEKPFWFIVHSLLIWLAYFLMTYVGFFVFDPTSHLGLEAALVAFIFGALGFVIPSPGGMGTYHFLIIQALVLFGIDSVDGFSFANILYFSIQIGCNVSLGLLALLVLPLMHRKPAVKTDTQNVDIAE